MDGVIHGSFPWAFWLGFAGATHDRDCSARASLPTTNTRSRISVIDLLRITPVHASVRSLCAVVLNAALAWTSSGSGSSTPSAGYAS
jgi:hypothetical protein